MRAEDVTHTPERSCRPQAAIRPVSGTNPGSCRTTAAAVVADLVDGLDERKSAHIRGAPGQPQTQGKIERWHQTLKNPIRLENYDLPGDLDAQIKASVERYTHRRDHESIDHRIPPDVDFGRGQAIRLERERSNRPTIHQRRWLHRQQAA
jgi:hypothetical protein